MKGRVLPLLLVLALTLSFMAPRTARAMPIPDLIITEIVPATTGTAQPYEYVEIYNTTNQAIDLHNYKLLYFTASPYTTPANRWTITNKTVPPKSALVLWLKKFDNPNVPLEDFNANYGTSLTPDQVFEVKLTTSGQGLHDSSKRRVAIGRPDETLISAAYINDGVADGTGKLNKSIIYKFEGALDMAKIANGQTATPGTLVPEQMPGSDDATPPAVPTGLTAVPGPATVSLSWTPVTDPDLAGYRVYRNGALQQSVGASQSGLVVERLAGGTHQFTVSALDQAGNESARSEPVSATPWHEPVTQLERSVSEPDSRYVPFTHLSHMGPVIPGLAEDLIPQGLAWWPGRNWLVTSHYMQDLRPSVLTIVDSGTGALVKSLRIYQEDGSAYTGHAGGVAITGQNLWVASGGLLLRVPLADILAAPDNGNVAIADRFPVETNASFVAFHDGTLWVGEFYHPTAGYNTKPTHLLTNSLGATYGAWIAAYTVDPATDQPASATPDRIFAIRNQIQGMALTPESIVVSRSYGRRNDSHLFRYGRPDLTAAPHRTVTVDGTAVPLWFLDETTAAATLPELTLPPLAEGIVTDGGSTLYVLFESGANEYRYDGFNPLERWALVDLEQWEQYGTIRISGLPARLEVGTQASLQVLRAGGNRGDTDVTAEATFSVADSQVAAITEAGVLTALSPGDTTLTVTYSGQQTTAAVHVVSVNQVTLSGAPRKLTVGQSVPLKVEALYSDGSTADVTAAAAFTLEHGGEVALEAGLLTAVKPGDVRILATYGGTASNELRLIVAPAEARNP